MNEKHLKTFFVSISSSFILIYLNYVQDMNLKNVTINGICFRFRTHLKIVSIDK
jgi:hypothetical protein